MIGLAFLVIGVYMLGWFIVARIINRNDVADVAWGLGFVVLAWTLYINRPSAQLFLAAILVSMWGIRLALHIFFRNRKKTEDARYVQWKKEWGDWYLIRSFFQVFMLQGLLLILISAPVVFMGRNGLGSIHPINILGVFIWIYGFFFEAVGDYQLKQFISNKHNKGKIMNKGLWRYTRHPNYFGEVTQWWAVWLVSYGSPWFIWGIIGPITITVLILRVSGIPLLEKRYEKNKKYQQYKKHTSKFFPLPSKSI